MAQAYSYASDGIISDTHEHFRPEALAFLLR
jgi:hypothetical protein